MHTFMKYTQVHACACTHTHKTAETQSHIILTGLEGKGLVAMDEEYTAPHQKTQSSYQ